MGSQASFYYAMNGFNVTQFDISEEALAACKAHHRAYIEPFRAAFPAFTDEAIDKGLARISYSADLESAAKDADFVTESVPEVLEIKQQVYSDLDRYCPQRTIFSTNTSTMPPSAIAPSTGRPERFLAVHYAMGIWDSPIAEVMTHPGTEDDIFQQVVDFVQASNLVPIKIEKEQPGYIINSHEDVDRTWMICAPDLIASVTSCP